ncbi:hypothetical protein STVIR_2084 [Streptomyces viridochromogenes Tue57]|uniref:Uncharacterized protein n=1 Tax=Streptomyces viridochromogenes Tue57 TaxID=1160705 RepID=L8PND8_STRVR|nr:hypothetical protein STVIR_2084 [Streptomyces viridochromogenes Tue57]
MSGEPRIRLRREPHPELVRSGHGGITLAVSYLRLHLSLYLSLSLYLFPGAFPAVCRHDEAA